MGYGTDGLTFNTLREANTRRMEDYRKKDGTLIHAGSNGSDWSPAQWLQALVGEIGEYANIRKKFERGDMSREEFTQLATKELADVQMYLDILAARCLDLDGYVDDSGINLGQAAIEKFNEVSDRVGSRVYISDNGSDYHLRPL